MLFAPTIATLSRIAKVLGVRVGYFFKDEGPEEAYEVVRSNERVAVTRVISSTGGEHGYTYHALTHKKRDKIMEPFLLTVDPGMRDEENLYSHEGEEFLLILEGEAEPDPSVPEPRPPGFFARWREKRIRSRRDREIRKEVEVRKRVDRLLEKIADGGMGVLSEKEKAFLRDASKRYQKDGTAR